MMVAGSIKGSDIPDSSSSTLDSRDTVEIPSKVTSEISNSPRTIKITRGLGRALGSTVIYTMTSTRRGMPGEVGLETWMSQDNTWAAEKSVVGSEVTGDPKLYSYLCSRAAPRASLPPLDLSSTTGLVVGGGLGCSTA